MTDETIKTLEARCRNIEYELEAVREMINQFKERQNMTLESVIEGLSQAFAEFDGTIELGKISNGSFDDDGIQKRIHFLRMGIENGIDPFTTSKLSDKAIKLSKIELHIRELMLFIPEKERQFHIWRY